jgi:hypothetical protein
VNSQLQDHQEQVEHQPYQAQAHQQHPVAAEQVSPQSNKYCMILNEIYQKSPAAYQDVAQDNSQPRIGDLRKSKLTLLQLNKLRRMNDLRTYEYNEKLKLVRQQYAPPAQPAM